jgi:hypothetical protein
MIGMRVSRRLRAIVVPSIPSPDRRRRRRRRRSLRPRPVIRSRCGERRQGSASQRSGAIDVPSSPSPGHRRRGRRRGSLRPRGIRRSRSWRRRRGGVSRHFMLAESCDTSGSTNPNTTSSIRTSVRSTYDLPPPLPSHPLPPLTIRRHPITAATA